MSSNKKYWKNVEDLNPQVDPKIKALKHNEFIEQIPVDEFLGDKNTLESSSTTRRDFLKYVGFSTAAASLAACEGPVIKSIPYVVKPDRIIPGVANYYATAVANGYDFASILVKTREGRPIKIEKNDLATTHGSANARVNASVLDLYDSLRLQAPTKQGQDVSWTELDTEITEKLDALKGSEKSIVLLTQTFASPSTYKLIEEFKAAYDNVTHVVYDAISESTALDAYQKEYGTRGLAHYDFSKATTIVSVGADFLGDWQGGGFDSGYAKGRIPKEGKMSRHIQFESNMTLTGANADKRIPLKPSEQKHVLAKLYSLITGEAVSTTLPSHLEEAVEKVSSEIKKEGSNAVVVSGIHDVNAQQVILAINKALSSKAFNPETPILTRQGDNKAVNKLIENLKAGQVGALLMCGVNPVYTLPNGKEFGELIHDNESLLSVAFSMKADETASLSQYVCAAPHYLESWNDVEFKKGQLGLMQPTIRPLFNTRQFQDTLLYWLGKTETFHDYIKVNWTDNILNGTSWHKALHDGVFEGESKNTTSNSDLTATSDTTSNTVVATTGDAARVLTEEAVSNFELTLYSKTGLGDGKQANNPWLQELPDPITRTTWDNYLTISKSDADNLGIKNWNVANGGLNGTLVELTVNNVPVTIPAFIQPGQAKETLGLALGYGRKKGLKSQMQTGKNAYHFYKDFNTHQSDVKLKVVSGQHEFACVQLHNTLMGRGDIIRETDLNTYNKEPKEHWNAVPVVSFNHEEIPVTSPDADLWDEFDRSIGHYFNLSIDLNACTGCGACVIACHAENNVPVVGKEEIRRSRDMHWLRIDRYYSSEDTFEGDNEKKDNAEGWFTGVKKALREMESPADNPQIAFQPIMCQHCNHAPCETVCPVAATSHGRQGQNHMAYNRCVGTRYCGNNCPYKVRRFNWFLYNENDEFDYYMNDDLGRMVINPDVVVRSRGVMEKCSMCIQMTQKTILDAKRDGREVKPDEFKTACSAACNSGAIVFGDINNEENTITTLKEDKRAYRLLASVGTKPNVMYQAKIRNIDEA